MYRTVDTGCAGVYSSGMESTATQEHEMTTAAATDPEFDAEAAVNLHDVVVIADIGGEYEVFVNEAPAEFPAPPIWISDGYFGTLGAALNRARDIVRLSDHDLSVVHEAL